MNPTGPKIRKAVLADAPGIARELVGEKKGIRGDAVLFEVAYRWRDVKLLRRSPHNHHEQ